MRKYLVVLIFYLGGLSMSTGQNLVLNPSLEDTVCLPNIDYYLPAEYWFRPSLGSTDYYKLNLSQNNCYINNYTVLGIQSAKTGYGFAGLATYSKSNPNRREYLGVKLNDTLLSGHDYCVEYYISLGGQCNVATSNFGIYFSVDSVNESSTANVLSFTPQVFYSGPPISDTLAWTLITGIYSANGGEHFICIGNFNSDASTDTINLTSGIYNVAYYYIDDINIYDCTVGLIEDHSLAFSIYPNPFDDKLFIDSDPFLKRAVIEISDSYGRLVYSSLTEFGTNGQELDLNFLADGIYFCALYSEANTVVKKIVKHSSK